MTSTILRSSTRYLFPVIALFSIFLLLRGHDEPGGGFVGGLLAALCFALYALADSVEAARRLLRVEEQQLIGIGLLLAAFSGLPGLLAGEPFLTTYWTEQWVIPTVGKLKVGTPLLFDVGVYLTVVGVVLMILFPLAEE